MAPPLSDPVGELPRPSVRQRGDVCASLAGAPRPALLVERAGPAEIAAYRALRREVFVAEQGLFGADDGDELDDDPRTIVLVARDNREPGRPVVGGVRLAPAGVAGGGSWGAGSWGARSRGAAAWGAGGSSGAGLSGAGGPGVESAAAWGGGADYAASGGSGADDLGWWTGSRLAVTPRARRGGGMVGAALVRAACATAERHGVLRFEATVQAANERFFARLGWHRLSEVTVAGAPHVLMRYPIGRIAALVAATKAPLQGLLTGLAGIPAGYVGDDGAPVPGSDLIAACDAIVPSMVERDPEWAGWCSVLVNVNDLAAMGAAPVGLLDAVGAPDTATARRVLAGLDAAARAWGVPVLGGHTQLGVPAALSVTALGRVDGPPRPERDGRGGPSGGPVPAGGGRPGDEVRVSADLGGGWRPGYSGRQWDSTSTRPAAVLRGQQASVAAAAPAAAKDVSMAGLVGTLGMLAEASGCGADLDVASVPRPSTASVGDWLTCFPGFAMITADRPGRSVPLNAPEVTSAVCGRLRPGAGVRLRWPDGVCTEVIAGPVTGMGPA